MKKLTAALVALTLSAPAASATWSILIVDHATGEVAIASATCLTNFKLEDFLPVVVVGKGVMAAQSAVDTSGSNRMIAFDLLMDGATPDDVLNALLTLGSSPPSRQYGIAAFSGPAATYSGSVVGDAIGNIVGQFGTFTYAIQGNVLTGNEVCFAAEEALLVTPGDVGQKLLAAMDAARDLGGDGRCSCDSSSPTGCGTPPPNFTKSAHTGFAFVARMGDTDGVCSGPLGCANGDYYLEIAYSGSSTDPDPIDQLQLQYDAWRAALIGRPDGVLSTVSQGATRLPADGTTTTRFVVQLVDVDGTPLANGGAVLSLGLSADSTADVTFGAVTDNGNGSYSFDLTAGFQSGLAELVIVADDGVEQATLYPYPSLTVDPAAEFHVGVSSLDPTTGGSVPLTLNVPQSAGGLGLILASVSGTVPGTAVGGVNLPLNLDAVLLFTLENPGSTLLQNTLAPIDGAGRMDANFAAPPNLLGALAGLRIDWAALHLGSAGLGATNADGFDVVSQ